jgi:Pyruvate/2-oxoacid:ferredoxin oxidoreductase gamma subunit
VSDLAGSLEKALPGAIYVDAAAIAKDVGNERTANMVLAGALSALTSFPEELWHKAMAETFTGSKAKLLEINEKAFALGRAAASA